MEKGKLGTNILNINDKSYLDCYDIIFENLCKKALIYMTG